MTDHRVLIVDDNHLVLSAVTKILAREGISVIASTSAKEALELAAKQHPTIIISDLMMPDMDGLAFFDAIRSNPEFETIPFIFLSAIDNKDDIRKLKALGADDYIVKPFEPEELVAIVTGKVHRAERLRKETSTQLEQYRKKIVNTLSHEFRTPLVAISTGTELLLQSQNKVSELEKVQTLIESIRRGGVRLERLVNDFMLLQQLEAGIAKRVIDDRAIDLPFQKVVDEILDHTAKEWTSRAIKISRGNEQAVVHCHLPYIRDAVLRLISNAIKFSPPTKDVEIITCDKGMPQLIIRDYGRGIDLDRMREALEPFTQLDREKYEQQGSGVGLALASRYITLHGGTIEFERPEDGGTKVIITLPHRS